MGKNQNNRAASDDVATGNDAQVSAPSPRNVTLKVDGEGNVIDEQAQTTGVPSTAGPTPNPEQNKNTGDGLSLPDGQSVTGGTGSPDGLQINTDELIESASTETTSADAEVEAKKKKSELLTQAINSRYYFENVRYENAETGEPVGGTRIRYIADPYKKTIYDYMNDETVNQHIGFDVDEKDPKDGSIVDKQISIYWKNPVF